MGQLKSLLDEMQTNLVLGLKKATGTDAGILLKAIRVTEVPDIQSADLAMSLEVREHLPPSAATTELRSRCRPEVKGSPWLAANAYSRAVRPSEQSHQCR